jgi:hypothetical protein
VLKVI